MTRMQLGNISDYKSNYTASLDNLEYFFGKDFNALDPVIKNWLKEYSLVKLGHAQLYYYINKTSWINE